MNRRSLAAAIAFVSPVALGVFSTSVLAEDDGSTVAALIDKMRVAMIARDKAVLDDLLAPELTYGHSDHRVQTKAVFMDVILTGKTQFNSITLSDQTIQIVGDVAVVRLRFQADSIANGKAGTPDLPILMVWQKRPVGWKLLIRQAY